MMRYARPFTGSIILLAALTVVANALAAVQPALLAALLSNLDGAAEQDVPEGTSLLDLNYLGLRVTSLISSGPGDGSDLLIVFGLLFLVQATLVAGTNYLTDYGSAWLQATFTRLIQTDLLNHLFSLDMAFFNKQKTGELMSRVTLDANSTAVALGPLLRSTIHHSVQIVIYSAYLFSTSVWLTLGALGLLTLQFVLTQVLRRPARTVTRDHTDESAGFLSVLQESLTTMRVAKSFGAEVFEMSKLRASVDRAAHALLRAKRFAKVEPHARSILDAFALLGIFLIAISQLRSGSLTFQGLLLFTYVGKLLIAPINATATNALWFETMSAAYSRVAEFQAVRPTVVDGAVPKTSFKSQIELRHVSFAYAGRPALDDITFEIERGEFIALVGASGAGKSTLADLLLRLYDPDSGDISVDGLNLRTLRQREYRQLFGVVSQENLLFHDSVRNNIRYGRDHLTEDQVISAARAAHAHDFILSLPQQYETLVGDRGVRLSGGERQRIAIARAVVHGPKILILDEATSALDSESERIVQRALNEIVRHMTAIVIAHRLSTVTHADRIVVLDQGRIEAIGSHKHLLEVSPIYQRVCRLQFDQPTKDAHRQVFL